MRFRAFDQAIENKETQREAFDRKRADVPSASTKDQFTPGTIISVCQPTPTLKKLTYQWSPPDHVVVEVYPATCVVRSLVAHGGVTLSKAVKDGSLPSRVINKKMMRSFRVPPSFFLGAKVLKPFGDKWYHGTVDQVHQDESVLCWHVTYSDFDGEDLEAAQLAKILIYHPLVDSTGDLSASQR